MGKHESVAAFMEALEHPLKPALKRVLEAIRRSDSSIEQAIKWNAPSFMEPKSCLLYTSPSPRDS